MIIKKVSEAIRNTLLNKGRKKSEINQLVEPIYSQMRHIQRSIGMDIAVIGIQPLMDKVCKLIELTKNNDWDTEMRIFCLMKEELKFLDSENKKRETEEYKQYSKKTKEILSGKGFVYRNMGEEELSLLIKGETISSKGDFSGSKTGTPSGSICFFHEHDKKNAENWMEMNTVKFQVSKDSQLVKSWGVYPDWDTADGEKILTEFYCKSYNKKSFEIIDIIRF